MADITFEIFKDGGQVPVTYTDDVLDEFRRNKVGLVDAQIEKLRRQTFPDRDDDDDGADLAVVGPLIQGALDDGDERVVAQCVLWLAVRHPDITGLDIAFGRYQFVSSRDSRGDAARVN
ncbi:MAG: hypothetical protein H6907_07850 [Hyphomicrobiales bacterium]|nr:hypothetical protein [Hyphomicrobiales bacterium]